MRPSAVRRRRCHRRSAGFRSGVASLTRASRSVKRLKVKKFGECDGTVSRCSSSLVAARLRGRSLARLLRGPGPRRRARSPPGAPRVDLEGRRRRSSSGNTNRCTSSPGLAPPDDHGHVLDLTPRIDRRACVGIGDHVVLRRARSTRRRPRARSGGTRPDVRAVVERHGPDDCRSCRDVLRLTQ